MKNGLGRVTPVPHRSLENNWKGIPHTGAPPPPGGIYLKSAGNPPRFPLKYRDYVSSNWVDAKYEN